MELYFIIMDYNKLFSADVSNFISSPVREIFKKVDLNQIYSFAGGYPNSSTFPIDEIKTLSTYVLEHYGAKALQYGGTQGVPELINAISSRYGVNTKNIQITTSSQQGIDVCARIFLNFGDTVLTTNPTYFGAIQSFKSYRSRIATLDGFTEKTCGLNKDDLFFAKFCYVIPDFQNPSGVTMSLEDRMNLIELSRKYGFVIVEDCPYRELRYEGEDVPSIYSLYPEGTLQLGSFSKIFAPGLRLGWIFGPEEILQQIFICKQSLDLCPPVLNQYIAAEYLSQGILDRVLPKSIEYYRSKRDLLLSLLEKYMPKGVTWTHPEGGLFLFLKLPFGFDAGDVYEDALRDEVAFVAGEMFYPKGGQHRNTMRLNFSFLDAERMEEGVKRLATIIKRNLPPIYKFSGAGNDFLMLAEDVRGYLDEYRNAEKIKMLCDRKTGFVAADGRIGADGLIILTPILSKRKPTRRTIVCDFKMDYFNSDGSSGMMCGNGGRCIVGFAKYLGIKPQNIAWINYGDEYYFLAADGIHSGKGTYRSSKDDTEVITISMSDATTLYNLLDGYFINTGTRHFVKFVDDVETVDVVAEGRKYRYDPIFGEEGINVNFVSGNLESGLVVRTYEKGVEDETLACGTGVVASAICEYYKGQYKERPDTRKVDYKIKVRSGDTLGVSFSHMSDIYADEKKTAAQNIFLSGPVMMIK